MRLSIRIIFLTFVLLSELSTAAPSNLLPPSRPPINEEPGIDENPDPTKVEPTNPSRSSFELLSEDTIVHEKKARRGPEDFNIHLGFSSGDIIQDEDRLDTEFLGVRYIPHSTFKQAWDFTVNAHLRRLVDFNVGHRWYFTGDDFFSTYYRFSLANYIDPSQNLAGLLNIRQIKTMAAVGMSDFLNLHRRFTAEIGVGYGINGTVFYLQTGYNFNY